MEKIRCYADLPPFTGINVLLWVIARTMGKDAQYIRYKLQKRILIFGYTVKLENSS